MKGSSISSFKEYIRSKDVLVLDTNAEEASFSWRVKEEEAHRLIKVMAELQMRFKGYSGVIGNRLPNTIGQLIEGSKVQIRRLKRDLTNLKEYGTVTAFDKLLELKGNSFLERAEKSVELARKSNYIENIYRSMRSNEICIGNVAPGNIGELDKPFIKDISRCSYDLIECDAITFLSRAKRKGSKLEYRKLIQEYTDMQGLEEASFSFILAMVNYPYEFMRACARYRSSKKDWTEEEYADSLKEAMLKDGEEI